MEDKIKQLISDEMANAVIQHGEFNSLHEAYAVILEEIEEAQEEITNLTDYLNELWVSIRGGGTTIENISILGARHGIKLIEEAIQIAAMFAKLKDVYKNAETNFTQSNTPHTESKSDVNEVIGHDLPPVGNGNIIEIKIEDENGKSTNEC